LNRHRPEG